MQDIHEINPPIMVGMDPALVKILWAIAAGLVLVTALIFLVRRFLKRSGALGPEDTFTSPVPPYEEAQKGLDRLAAQKAMDPKTFYFELGALVKTYIGRIHDIHASEMTTQELSRKLRSTAMDRNLVTQVARFQDCCDPFRYGPIFADSARMKADLDTAGSLVNALEKDVEKIRQARAGSGDKDTNEPEQKMAPPRTRILDSEAKTPKGQVF